MIQFNNKFIPIKKFYLKGIDKKVENLKLVGI